VIVGLNTEIGGKTNPITSPVAAIIRHPKFNADKGLNDIALLKLRRPISKYAYNGLLSGDNFVKLPVEETLEDGENCLVLGWGSTEQMGTVFVCLKFL